MLSEDVLPNSTERSVTISGEPDQIHETIKKVFRFLLERPPDKSNSLPYRPIPGISSVSSYHHSPSPGASSHSTPYLETYGQSFKKERVS